MKRVFVLIFAIVVTANSQSPNATKPSFEVATIKRNTSAQGRSRQGDQPGGRFVATRVTLRTVMGYAYRGAYGPLGGPNWIDSDLWDIEAKAPDGSVPPRAGPPDLNAPDTMALMVQSLIEDRFRLKMHTETREVPVYELTVAKGGPKLKLSEDQSPAILGQPTAPPPPGTVPRGAMKMVRGDLEGSAISFSNGFVQALSLQLGRKVIDKTGLHGLYDFKLLWTPDPTAAPAQPGTPLGPEAAPADPLGPSIFTAIEEQLGLRLESGKSSIEALLIDSIQRPTEN
jgi:uncharacterized protein (TIGR03435 family)